MSPTQHIPSPQTAEIRKHKRMLRFWWDTLIARSDVYVYVFPNDTQHSTRTLRMSRQNARRFWNKQLTKGFVIVRV